MFFLFFFIGFFNLSYHRYILPQKIINTYSGREISVTGKVDDLKNYANDKLRFILKSFPSILVKVKGKLKIKEGEVVRISEVVPYSVEKVVSPYMKEYYMRKGVYLCVNTERKNIKKIKDRGFISILRERIKSIFSGFPVIGALVLGKEMNVPQDVRGDFIKAGVIHLFAVSGLHFGIIFLLLLSVFSFWFSKRYAAIISIFVLSFYFFLVGFHPSVVRAYIMILLYVFSLLFYREYDLLSALSFSCLLILIFNPLELFEPGFLLSFSSVFFIYLYDKMIEKETLIRPFYALFFTIWIWSGNLPIIVNFFHRVPLLSILFTPITGFLALIFIPFGFVILFVGMFVPHLAHLLLLFVSPFLNLYKQMVHVVSSLPFSSYVFPTIPVYGIFLWYGSMAFLFCLFRRKRYKIAVSFVLLAIVCLIIFSFFPLPLELHFISVGEGDAIFIRYPYGPNILVDGGNMYNGRKVSEYLKRKGVNRIDLLFITHPDTDHWGGLKDIIPSFKINTVIINGQKTEDQGYNKFLKKISSLGIPIRVMREPDSIYISSDFSLSILNPQRDFYFEKDNDNSIVIGLRYGMFSAILTGDLEAEGEVYLVKHNLVTHYDVLKVAHHGSGSSTTPLFLDKVSPMCAVISVGKNRYGHPSRKVIKLLMKKGIKIYRTDVDKDIVISSYGKGWRILTSGKGEHINYELSKSNRLPKEK